MCIIKFIIQHNNWLRTIRSHNLDSELHITFSCIQKERDTNDKNQILKIPTNDIFRLILKPSYHVSVCVRRKKRKLFAYPRTPDSERKREKLSKEIFRRKKEYEEVNKNPLNRRAWANINFFLQSFKNLPPKNRRKDKHTQKQKRSES